MPAGFVAAIVLDCQFGSFCLCFLLVWFGIPTEERIKPSCSVVNWVLSLDGKEDYPQKSYMTYTFIFLRLLNPILMKKYSFFGENLMFDTFTTHPI